MRTLLHISDLHFGRVDSRLVEALRASVEQLRPDVIAVSGDLTQRAKRREFAAASAFLGSLRPPKIIVPGNHDIPLYNVFTRFGKPLDRYRRYIGSQIEPSFMDEEIAVVGVNTARSLTFKGGRINADQVKRARDLFCHAAGRVRILVTHHPFHFGSARDGDLVRRAGMALDRLRDCMPDVLLAGHMHAHEVGTTAQRYDLGGNSAVVVQAGTATSTRDRGEANSFNVLQVELRSIAVCRHEWQPGSDSFVARTAQKYVRREAGWISEDA
jgi:3',5'-cyclic AMP phosphodiesterase CpdA